MGLDWTLEPLDGYCRWVKGVEVEQGVLDGWITQISKWEETE